VKIKKLNYQNSCHKYRTILLITLLINFISSALFAQAGVYSKIPEHLNSLTETRPNSGLAEAAPNLVGNVSKGGECFAAGIIAGTMVETVNGLRSIEQIKVGDLVWSRDQNTGQTDFKPVTTLFASNSRNLYEVRLEKRENNLIETFLTTIDQRWLIDDERWLTTFQLKSGVNIKTKDGTQTRVISVASTGAVARIYNIAVQDFHTYFVGLEQALVHNASFCGPAPSQNELNHIFGNPGHNLDPVVQAYGGQMPAYEAMYDAFMAAFLAANYIAGKTVDYGQIITTNGPCDVGGFPITMKGIIPFSSPNSPLLNTGWIRNPS
jgi:hypothetical protein